MAYEQNRQYEDSVSAHHRALSYSPNNTITLASLGYVYAISGNEEKAWEIIKQLKGMYHLMEWQKYTPVWKKQSKHWRSSKKHLKNALGGW